MEEQRLSYDNYVLKLLADYDAKNNPQPEVEEKTEEKGFFGRLFGR